MDRAEIKSKIEKGWLRANLIIEVLGKPAEHIEKALEFAIEAMEKEKKVNVLNKKIHKAVLVKESKDVYTTFAEIEILVDGLYKLIEIVFDYMPSSVEIVEPTTLSMKLEDANALLNDLAMRLHQYDALLKKGRLELEILKRKLKELGGKA